MKERRLSVKIMAFVMAGGEGKRLRPLTKKRSKPAVPFGGRYRLVDFVLSNLVNSDVRAIYLLVQYKAQSLIEHVRKSWTISPLLSDQFVTVVPPQMQEGSSWFMGTADAVYQNLNLLKEQQPDIVAVFGADHIYRMDIRQMAWFHQKRQADVSVAAIPVPISKASDFGVIQVNADGRINCFQEKPDCPCSMSLDSTKAYASMGNYLFNTEVLIEVLEKMHQQGKTDFGRDVLPQLLKNHRLFAYDFSSNEVPGVKSYEESSYWRDVGSLDAYFQAHQDMLGIQPKFDIFNPRWPVFSSIYQGPVAQVIEGQINNSLLGAGTFINKANIHNSIVRNEVVVEPGAELHDCIIMDYVRVCRGARLRRVIIDRHNIIKPGTTIGYDAKEDRRRYHVTSSGLVVVPSGKVNYFARDSRETNSGDIERL